MENVTVDSKTNQSVTTIPQPASDVCKTCIDWVITNGVLGGVPGIVVIALALFVVCCRKRTSGELVYSDLVHCRDQPELILSTAKYDAMLIFLAFASTSTYLSVVTKLVITCAKVNPIKCSVGYGWIAMACFVVLSIVVSVAITVYLHFLKETIEREAKVSDLQEYILRSKQLCDDSKILFSDIKTTDTDITEKGKQIQQIQRQINEWRNKIEEAKKLVKEIQGTRTEEGEPLIADTVLEKKLQSTQPKDRETTQIPENFQFLQYLNNAQESGHENNIEGLDHEASKEVQLRKEEISQGQLMSWQKDEETFSPTKATEYIYREAETKKNILLVGFPGAGKSANAHHVALRLKDNGYRVFCMDRVKEMVEMIDKSGENKQVYVFDDVFGVHGVKENKRSDWSDENKDNLERCLKMPNVITICTSRLTVINDDKLSNVKSHFTIINISQGEIELSDDERVEIFRKHATAERRDDLLKERNQLKDNVKRKIKEIKCPLGCFPLVCRLFTGDKETEQTIENYFNKPLKVIADNLDKLRTEEPLRHFCLLLCLMYENKLPMNIISVGDETEDTKKLREELYEACELEISTLRSTIKKKMDTLLQTFLKLEGESYRFVHEIVYDAVVKHVSTLSADVHKAILRHCSNEFMGYRIHLSGVQCKDFLGRSHDTDSCININRDAFTYWGIRVLDILHKGRPNCHEDTFRAWYDNPWWDVFSNNPCVRSTVGQMAIAQALAGKSQSDAETIMCTSGYRMPFVFDDTPHTALHWAMNYELTQIVLKTLSMISQTKLQQLDTESRDTESHGLLNWAQKYSTPDIQQILTQKLQ